jgi:hypothetical protein
MEETIYNRRFQIFVSARTKTKRDVRVVIQRFCLRSLKLEAGALEKLEDSLQPRKLLPDRAPYAQPTRPWLTPGNPLTRGFHLIQLLPPLP